MIKIKKLSDELQIKIKVEGKFKATIFINEAEFEDTDEFESFKNQSDEAILKALPRLMKTEDDLWTGIIEVDEKYEDKLEEFFDTVREALKLDESSRILVFGTEGDTDEKMYEKMVGRSAVEVLKGS